MANAYSRLSPTEKVNSHPTMDKDPGILASVAPEEQPFHGQNREQIEIDEDHSTIATTSSQPPGEKAKRRFQSKQESITAFWNSLSKVWLTPRALDELDRRNRQSAGSVRTSITSDQIRETAALKHFSYQIKRFAKHGGPDLCGLRGYPKAYAMPGKRVYVSTKSKSSNTLDDSTATATAPKAEKLSPYDANFEQSLINNHIYPSGCDFPDDRVPPKPNNWKEINKRLKKRRLSLSPSHFPDAAFDTFVRTNAWALNEDAVMADVFPIMVGNSRIRSAKNMIFRNLKPLDHCDFVNAKPDFYDGVCPAQIDLRIRKELSSYVIPATQGHAPALPTLFTEVKGPEGSAAVAKRQACYDGVLGERGILALKAFEMNDSKAMKVNDAHTITSTYNSATGSLHLYSIHQTQSTDFQDVPEYHMTPIDAFVITGNAKRFREGVTAFRNARDWAKEQRDEVIAAANSRINGMPNETSTLEPSAHSQPTMGPNAVVLEPSADEISQDVDRGSSFSNKRRKIESGEAFHSS